jgi:hypothetical protein
MQSDRSQEPLVTETASFPDDENGDVLRRMASHGEDLGAPRNVDFEHIFTSVEAALEFIAQVVNRTDTVSLNWYDARSNWNVRVTRCMTPTHQGITELELSLDQVARKLGGKADGWGCMQVKGNDA